MPVDGKRTITIDADLYHQLRTTKEDRGATWTSYLRHLYEASDLESVDVGAISKAALADIRDEIDRALDEKLGRPGF